MKANVIKKFEYNGLSIRSKELREGVGVEVLGVLKPVDPGMVYIEYGDGVREEVPTLVLDCDLDINFGAMLTEEQIIERNKCGILFAPPMTGRKLVPLSECVTHTRCPTNNKIIAGRDCPPCFGIKNKNDECNNKCIECKKEADRCEKDTVESDPILRVMKTLLFKT